jgi:hypothetical protein
MEHVTEWQASATSESHTDSATAHPRARIGRESRHANGLERLFRVLPEKPGLAARPQLPGVQGW